MSMAPSNTAAEKEAYGFSAKDASVAPPSTRSVVTWKRAMSSGVRKVCRSMFFSGAKSGRRRKGAGGGAGRECVT